MNERRCAAEGCETILSRYNPENRCAAHEGLKVIPSPTTDGLCTVENCGVHAHARGLCSMHYSRWRKHGDPAVSLHRGRPRKMPTTCEVDGCPEPTVALGLCDHHYRRQKRHGNPTGGNRMAVVR